MPLEIDITKDARYKEGERIGEKRGLQRATEHHVEKLLQHKFTVEEVAEILGLEKDFVEEVKKKKGL